MLRHRKWQTSRERERECVCVHYNQQVSHNILSGVLIISPCDEASSHGGPGDTAGVRLLALLLFIFTAAAQTAQVDGQTQQVEAEPRGRHTAQKYERLQGEKTQRGRGDDTVQRLSQK